VDEAFDNTQAYQNELKTLEAKGYELVKADQQSGTYTPASQTLYSEDRGIKSAGYLSLLISMLVGIVGFKCSKIKR
jgi:hypothetical protein